MSKINAAESIRGLACLAVVFSHLAMSFFPYLHHFDPKDQADPNWVSWVHHSPFAFVYSGDAAVFVFFVLSGYVLSYALLKNPQQFSAKLKAMMIKRYPRLMIPALISCLLVWSIMHWTAIDSSLVGAWLQAFATQNFSVTQALFEGTIGAFFYSDSNINWVLWTMTIELMGSFALFLVLSLYVWKKSLSLYLAFALIGLAWWWRGQGFSFGITSFLLGMMMYLYAKPISNRVAIALLLFGLYLAGAHNHSSAYAWVYAILGEHTYDYCNFFAGIVIVYSILMSPMLSKKMDRPGLVWLGKLSFSIYLLHLLMLYLVCIPLFNILYGMGLSYTLTVTLSASAALIMTLLAADLYSRYVDESAIRFSQFLANLILRQKH